MKKVGNPDEKCTDTQIRPTVILVFIYSKSARPTAKAPSPAAELRPVPTCYQRFAQILNGLFVILDKDSGGPVTAINL